MTLDKRHLPVLFKKNLNETPVQVIPITTGKHNQSFFVNTEKNRYVIRIAPTDETPLLFYERNMMSQEPVIHNLLLEKTSIPVAEVVFFDNSRRTIDRDYIIMRRLPGIPVSGIQLSGRQYESVMRRIGECLSEVHAITSDLYGYIGPHKPMEPQKTWFDAFRIMWRKLLDDITSTGMYPEQVRDGLVSLLENHTGSFNRNVPSSLLHMDVWAQNILVDGDYELTGLLDWDRALYGDPEIEYAVLDYCGISTPGFWEGYGILREQSPEADIRRIFYHLYEHQKYIFIRLMRRNNPAQAVQYKNDCLRIAGEYLGFRI